MEHRWSLRKRLTTGVLIYRHGIPVTPCESRDVGLEGMFVKSGPLNYFRNTRLDVEFSLNCPDTGQAVRYRLPAVVVHTANDGLGVTFIGSNPHMFRALGAIIYGSTSITGAHDDNVSLAPTSAVG